MNQMRARVVAGIAVALACAELWVRPSYTLSVVYEPGIGYVNAPGQARWGLEGFATTTWLPHGERFTPGHVGGARVLVLGDSFTEALMIPDDATYVAVAQREANAHELGIDLVNAGRATMSTADFVALAPRYRELFPARWMVAEIRSSDLAEDAWSPGRTRFERGSDGTLRAVAVVPPERTGVGGRFFELRQRSMLAGFGFVRIGKFRAGLAAEPPMFNASKTRPPASSAPEPPVEEELDQLVAAWNGRLTILYLSEFAGEDRVEPRVRSYCAARGVSCTFTAEANESLRARGKAPTGFADTGFGEGHLNSDGHAIAGHVLASELERVRGRIVGRAD